MSPDAHKTVLLKEAVDALDVKADGIYVDGTFGRGGHSREILSRLGAKGRVIALDRDPQAVAAAEQLRDGRLSVRQARFSALDDVLREYAADGVDGVLLDLGVSSPQVDEAQRGFSFKQDGPLDMRMDPDGGPSAAEWLMQASEKEIGEVIKTYGEERFAKQIARAIVAARSQRPLQRTRELAEIVAKAVPTREPRQDPATRTFQAIRIFINQELEELEMTLPQCVACLKPGGRLVIISFHSLEDRIVKQTFKQASTDCVCPPEVPVCICDHAATVRLVNRKPKVADAGEIERNPRSRSAKLRVVEKL